MKKIAIFGNSGSGKSTLARKLCEESSLRHLDLDSVAWKASKLPERKPIEESLQEINDFILSNKGWVIEGCYSDLLEVVLRSASEIVFLNLPLEDCIDNARNRPWEPHKYESKECQDQNLEMLIEWIAQYEKRTDTFSKSDHELLFSNFRGAKIMYTSNQYDPEA